MIGDTIVACASAAGSSERAIVRLSGPRACEAAARVFSPALPAVRAQVEGRIRVADGQLPALALVMVGPASFTGEHTVELHVPGSPLLVQLLLEALLLDGAVRGVRLALPGEFTARACQNGRLDLAQVEGLLMLLHAGDQREAAAAVQWLRGGIAGDVTAARAELQDVLALVEVGLDFGDGEAGAVATEVWLAPLSQLACRLRDWLAGLPIAAPGGEVLLLGRANAGKSSLANALAGRREALVDATPGTTRDLLRIDIEPGVAVWDAPGDLDRPGEADAAALALRDRLAGRAAGCLLVLDRDEVPVGEVALPALPCFGVVWTKCDDGQQPPPPLPPAVAARLAPSAPIFVTSARCGTGLLALRAHLRRVSTASTVDAGGPLRLALSAAHGFVARAIESAATDAGAEVVAVDLRAALQALDGIAGRHSDEQVLDRIYGRFCLGK